MTKPTILVTSAAGNTGIPTTLQLLEKGYPVRAFVRRDDRRETNAKQNLLVTKTVRLKKEKLNVRYAELGDPAKPTAIRTLSVNSGVKSLRTSGFQSS